MNAAWGFLAVLGLLCRTQAGCSPTSYYKNCWIRRFPGIFIDVEESERRGARLLQRYPEESALQCSRACCLTRNFSCNLAVFRYDASRDNVNCLHLHCPTLESCILSRRLNVVLYNITKGVDPDLLVFGKHFGSSVRVLPHHYGRVNASEPLPPDKRQFIHPQPPAAPPLTSAPSSVLPPAAVAPTPKAAPCLPTGVANRSPESGPRTSTTPPPSAFSSAAFSPPSPPPSHRPHAPTASPRPPTAPESGGRSTSHAEVSGGGGGRGPGWRLAAKALAAAVAICVAVLLCCCCSFLSLVSWGGRRRRRRGGIGQGGGRGSMRLVKYVLVRENA